MLNERADVIIKQSTPTDVWRIKIDNTFVTLPSGKSSWKKIGHAKNALHHAMHNTYHDCRYAIDEHAHSMCRMEKDDFMQECYNTFIKNRVQFIKV